MRIEFKTAKLARVFNSFAELQKAYGLERARKMALRMKVLEAAPSLADVPTVPPDRCHELKGDRQGEFAVDIAQPHRIIFRPTDARARGKGGKIDFGEVTQIVILGVEDYHGD
jgi:plasmid maintenance system killer protein